VTIRKIETDERRPSRQIAERLAECLQVPADQCAAFLQAARAELAVDRLTPPIPPLAPAIIITATTLPMHADSPTLPRGIPVSSLEQ
jgi:hypothetical protein